MEQVECTDVAIQLTDFGVTYGTVLFQAQAETFKMSIPAVANSVNGALFLQGPGGILAVPLIQRFGRLPVLFYSQIFCAIWVMAAALAPGYASFTAFRALQGFFNTAPQVVGLSFIHDMSVIVVANVISRIELTIAIGSSFMNVCDASISGSSACWVDHSLGPLLPLG